MKSFLDTSVLIAVFYGDDGRHDLSAAVYRRLDHQSGACAAHSLAEVYSTLTGMPGIKRATPQEALLFLSDVRERLTLVALDALEYSSVIESAAGLPLLGGGIYDALIAASALKWSAEAIYTWNERHFRAVGPPVSTLVRTP